MLACGRKGEVGVYVPTPMPLYLATPCVQFWVWLLCKSAQVDYHLNLIVLWKILSTAVTLLLLPVCHLYTQGSLLKGGLFTTWPSSEMMIEINRVLDF